MAEPEQPGWKTDPQRPGMQRWWNGLGWSDAYRPLGGTGDHAEAVRAATDATRERMQEAMAAADPRAAPLRTAAKAVGTVNGAAVAAVVLGVLALLLGSTVLFGAVAVVGLVVSLSALNRSRRLAREGVRPTGFGQSMAGLILSVLGLLRWLPVLAGLLRSFSIDLS